MTLKSFSDLFGTAPKVNPSTALVKTKAIITAGSLGKVELSDVSGVTFGGEFSAQNIGDVDIASGKLVMISEDPDGVPFFRPGGGAPVCGPGDCPDSCFDTSLCFDVIWSILGGSSGIFTVPILVGSVCLTYLGPMANPNGFGSVIDPATGRPWVLTVEWDACAGIQLFTLEDCNGVPVFIDENLGGTISAPACSLDIDILIVPSGGQPCSTANTFPCCDPLEGCVCG